MKRKTINKTVKGWNIPIIFEKYKDDVDEFYVP